MKIAMLHLETEDHIQADSYLNRAARITHLVTDTTLQTQFMVQRARVEDYKREFFKVRAMTVCPWLPCLRFAPDFPVSFVAIPLGSCYFSQSVGVR